MSVTCELTQALTCTQAAYASAMTCCMSGLAWQQAALPHLVNGSLQVFGVQVQFRLLGQVIEAVAQHAQDTARHACVSAGVTKWEAG